MRYGDFVIHFRSISQNNGFTLNNNQASMESVLDFSQGFSTTHFKVPGMLLSGVDYEISHSSLLCFLIQSLFLAGEICSISEAFRSATLLNVWEPTPAKPVEYPCFCLNNQPVSFFNVTMLELSAFFFLLFCVCSSLLVINFIKFPSTGGLKGRGWA